MLEKILGFLKGKKSYVVGLAVIMYGLYQHFWGDQLSWTETVDYIFGGAGFITIRAALAKIGINGG